MISKSRYTKDGLYCFLSYDLLKGDGCYLPFAHQRDGFGNHYTYIGVMHIHGLLMTWGKCPGQFHVKFLTLCVRFHGKTEK